MKRTALGVTASLLLLTANLEAAQKYNGYSYIGFGMETASYSEIGTTTDGTPFKSSATTSSPVYTSGSLIHINKNFDFSIDASSTLIASQTNEKWQEGGYVTQENKYDTIQSDLKFLLQYKITDNHRLIFGPNYNLFSMKRHTYINPADGTEKLVNGESIGLNQEDIATLNGMIGYRFEHAPFSNGGMRISASILYGTPLWNQATNTGTSEIEFSSTKGSTINANGYVGFQMIKGLELGVFGGYTLKNKDGADDIIVGSNTITWPENELETFRYGISLSWNFDVK
ncbi:MAG: hypothetical protein U9N59_10070 [Campylobacterota bacterium]|nr:hypothetical protein [Campylobacterota bacterium]